MSRRMWRDRTKRRKAGEAGFSLVEVLISLVLLALVLSLLTGAVGFARGTWDAATRLDREAGYDAAAFVRARLSEAVPLFELTQTGIAQVAFKGASDSLAFVAPTQNGPAGTGLYRFVLELGPANSSSGSRGLLVRLAPYQPTQGRDAGDILLEDHLLAENVKEVTFRYFGRKDLRANPAWHTIWTRADALPDLVEMTIVHKGRPAPSPLVVELRLGHRN